MNRSDAQRIVTVDKPRPAGRWFGLGLGLVLVFLLLPAGLLAAQPPMLGFSPGQGAHLLLGKDSRTVLCVDASDYPGVRRAAADLRSDLERVTGLAPRLEQVLPADAGAVVIIGTLGRSALVDRLVAEGKLDVSAVAGRWEAFVLQAVADPLPGVKQALVVAGSDKRGAIYGIYELSEQAGVSPWAWWADVPVLHRDALYYTSSRTVEAGPAVKYRGIFLNDEEPALGGWAREKFGGFNSRFYARVFELLLRLRANYLWPAMWNSAFNEDDPLNPALADEYGIVMGTSHHEPMVRSQQEWIRHGKGHWDFARNSEELSRFWAEGIRRNKAYESLVTLGMRGDGDMPMEESENVGLLQSIVARQREILARETGKSAEKTPQLWALYKEVQGYFEKGMRVPDDVTLLWCDDNWGNIRRLPTAAERGRAGGAGVYYHFDYVGGPRSYMWLWTVPLPKVWEQMHLAWRHGADRIWIVNVGDLKPMEIPIEFFLRMAWAPSSFGPDSAASFPARWAARDFGPAHAGEIGAIISDCMRYHGRRKPELLAPETYSALDYGEAARVVDEWTALERRAEAVAAALPAAYQDAYYQLVLHPVKAGRVVNEMLVLSARNRLYASQGRSETNRLADRVRELFREDAALTARYHQLGGGRWNHFMSQTHLGYTTWAAPSANVMPPVSELQLPEAATMAVALEGSASSWKQNDVYLGPVRLPLLDCPDAGGPLIQVFNRGRQSFRFRASADVPWLRVSPSSGEVTETCQLSLEIDWSKVPAGSGSAYVQVVREGGGQRVSVEVPWRKAASLTALPSGCFLETGGVVVIEAAHASRALSSDGVSWTEIPGYGRTHSGMTTLPVTDASSDPSVRAPVLEYDLHLNKGGPVALTLLASPSLAFVPGRGLRLAVSLDGGPLQLVDLQQDRSQAAWDKAVSDAVKTLTLPLGQVAPGLHTLRIHRVDPGVVLERLILDAGGLRPSYLGPRESPRVP